MLIQNDFRFRVESIESTPIFFFLFTISHFGIQEILSYSCDSLNASFLDFLAIIQDYRYSLNISNSLSENLPKKSC